MKKWGKGFTLIELLIVIGILAILAVTVVALSRQSQARKELNLTVDSIVSALRDAQQKSLTQLEGQRWGMQFKDETNLIGDQYQLFKDTYSAANVTQTYFLSPLLTFDSTGWSGSPPVKQVIFRQVDGIPIAGQSDIIIKTSDGQVSRTITVTAEGTITY